MINIDKNTDVKIKCYKCGNQYDMGMMRMDPNGKNLVCKNCLDRKSSSGPDQKSSSPKSDAGQDADKEYFCKECKYNFKRASHLAIRNCPYCGSSKVITKGSTARIVADAFRMKG